MTAAHGRRFGLTVGAAFVALAALMWWRGYAVAAMAFASLGGALVIAGTIVPTHLGPVERAWMALAHAISKVTTPIVMGAMYLGVVTPVGVLRRWLGGNPLVHTAHEQSFWKPRPAAMRRSRDMRRQF